MNNSQSGKAMVEVVRCHQPHQKRLIANQLHSPSHLNTFHRCGTQTCEDNNTHVRAHDRQAQCCNGFGGANNENTKNAPYHL